MGYRLLVCGACGKMGARIKTLAENIPDVFSEVHGIEAPGYLSSLPEKVRASLGEISSDLSSFSGKVDVLIDFTAPEATLKTLQTVRFWKGVSVVIGTTGFTPEQLETIKEVSKQIPIVLSPNMSVGVNLMLELVRLAAQKLKGHGYDIEIIETHHRMKKDSPSGTALALQKEVLSEINSLEIVHGRVGNVGPRKSKEIGMHAIRGGDVIGDHTVLFATEGERLEITHKASSRDTFAVGALRAAAWVAHSGVKPGLYGMKDVLR